MMTSKLDHKSIIDQLIENYLILVDLYIGKQKDYEYTFSGYSNQKLADMLEFKAKFEYNIDEVTIEIRRLAKTHKYAVIYDNINLFIWFAKSYGENVGNLYMIEPHMSAHELGELYQTRKIKENNLLEHIQDFKDFVNINWDPNNEIVYRMRINEILKTIRTEAGLSQVQLAELIDATQGTISNLEKSIMANPTFDILRGYVTKVGANPVFLFGLDPSAPPIIHPSIQVERMKGAKDDQTIKQLVKELESTIKKLKSL